MNETDYHELIITFLTIFMLFLVAYASGFLWVWLLVILGIVALGTATYIVLFIVFLTNCVIERMRRKKLE